MLVLDTTYVNSKQQDEMIYSSAPTTSSATSGGRTLTAQQNMQHIENRKESEQTSHNSFSHRRCWHQGQSSVILRLIPITRPFSRTLCACYHLLSLYAVCRTVQRCSVPPRLTCCSHVNNISHMSRGGAVLSCILHITTSGDNMHTMRSEKWLQKHRQTTHSP